MRLSFAETFVGHRYLYDTGISVPSAMSSSLRAQIPSNDENTCPIGLRNKAIRRNNPPTKRIALSTINENVRRSKPLVTLKGTAKPLSDVSLGFNNAYSLSIAPSSAQTFTIFQENEQESVPENVISLYKADNEEAAVHEESDESCMALDMSLERPKPKEDRFLCHLYSKSIYDYLRSQEKKFRPSPNYMRKQPDITLSMRSILVDWLVEVAEEYKMLTETLYLAVSYTDRFLSVMSVLRCKLQLVGTASMYIAAKYEEIYPPELREFVYITDDTYSKKQVLRMEHLILKVLAFDLSAPTAYTFLQHFCIMINIPDEIRYLAEYLCELSLLEAQPYLSYLPSEIACASLCLANYTLGRECWSAQLKDATGYSLGDFRECLENLFVTYSKAETYPQQAVREKYKSSKYGHVSEIPSPERLEVA